jgi:hypothetical protein
MANEENTKEIMSVKEFGMSDKKSSVLSIAYRRRDGCETH